MATYAIGDIQGCYDDLKRLLEKIQFDPRTDQIWFAGDLVNRGPKSLQVLRFIYSLGKSAVAVLGNHDLHLLALWQQTSRHFRSSDTFAPILSARDGYVLLEWLRHRPLMHYDSKLNYAMVHAGLPPQWTIKQALKRAAEAEATLQGPDFRDFLDNMYGNKPKLWSKELQGYERLRFIVNCFSRLRYCTVDGELELKDKGSPNNGNNIHQPWFQVEGRRSRGTPIVFGHWSTLGLHTDDGVRGIDTGCLWGGSLSALRLDDGSDHVIAIECEGYSRVSAN